MVLDGGMCLGHATLVASMVGRGTFATARTEISHVLRNLFLSCRDWSM